MTIAMAMAPSTDSPKGTLGTHALRRAEDQADSSALGSTYIAAQSQLHHLI